MSSSTSHIPARQWRKIEVGRHYAFWAQKKQVYLKVKLLDLDRGEGTIELPSGKQIRVEIYALDHNLDLVGKGPRQGPKVNFDEAAFLDKMLSLQRFHLDRSVSASERERDSWILCCINELTELKESLENQDLEEAEKEIGDVFSTMIALLISLKKEGVDLKSVFQSFVDKLENRRPWIFPHYLGDRPKTAVEEDEYWESAKKKEKQDD